MPSWSPDGRDVRVLLAFLHRVRVVICASVRRLESLTPYFLVPNMPCVCSVFRSQKPRDVFRGTVNLLPVCIYRVLMSDLCQARCQVLSGLKILGFFRVLHNDSLIYVCRVALFSGSPSSQMLLSH